MHNQCSVCNVYGHEILQCPRVESVEYFERGGLKKITLREPRPWPYFGGGSMPSGAVGGYGRCFGEEVFSDIEHKTVDL